MRCKVVREASIDRLLNQRDRSLLKPFIAAARQVEADGVKAITGACSFMALSQPEMAGSVSIPVLMSSLMQIPFMHRISGPDRRIGVITADEAAQTEAHFSAVGLSPDIPLAVAGVQEKDESARLFLNKRHPGLGMDGVGTCGRGA